MIQKDCSMKALIGSVALVSWLQVSVLVEAYWVSEITAKFQQLGSLSVSLASADGSSLIAANNDSELLWDNVCLCALFPLDFDPAPLDTFLNKLGLRKRKIEFISERDWEAEWRESLIPRQFGRVSIWPKRYEKVSDQVVVRLDPGMAFGTGEHPTTALCLNWLAKQDLRGRRVLDFGCGSGVLGITAKKLEAGSVVLIDTDPLSCKTARENAQFNEVEVSVESNVNKLTQQYDMVVANILLNVLVDYADKLTTLLVASGEIVLSGLLKHQFSEIQDAYPRIDFQEIMSQDEWILVYGRKISQPTPSNAVQSR